MTKLLLPLVLSGLTATTAYLLLKPLLLWGGKALSQHWHCRAGTAAALLFLLPLYKVWGLAPAAPVSGAVSPMTVPVSAPVSLSWLEVLNRCGTVWAVGMGCLLLWDLLCFLRFRRQLRQAEPLTDGPLLALAQAQAQALGIRAPVRLLRSEGVSSPMLAGYVRPVLLLPEGEPAPEDARLVLAHELLHFRRGDLWRKLLVQAAARLHWYNPAVFLLKRDLLYWMETACDEAVVRSLDFAQRKRYGYLLIDGASPFRLRATGIPFAPSRKTLERRISTMLYATHTTRGLIGSVLAMALAASCLVTTAFAADLNKEATPAASSEVSITVNGKGLDFNAPLSNESVTYTIVTSDSEDGMMDIDVASTTGLCSVKDLGNGEYEIITEDGESYSLTIDTNAAE